MRTTCLLHGVVVALVFLCNTGSFAQMMSEAEDLAYADRLFTDKFYDLAALQYQRYADRFPTSPKAPQALLQACRALFLSGQHEAALRTGRDALLRFPGSALLDQFLFQQGQAHEALTQLHDAALAFERITAFVPGSSLAPEGLLRAARLYQHAGEYDDCERVAGLLLDKYPTSPMREEARLLLATAGFHLGQLEEALAEAEKLITPDLKKGTTVRALALKAEILDRLGQFTEAERILRQVAEATADSTATATAAFRLGKVLQGRGEYAQSARFAERAAQFATDKELKARSALLKAQSLLQAGSANEALAAFALASSLAPGDSLRAEAWLGAGNAALQLAQFATARQHFDAVRALPVGERLASERTIAAATIGAMRASASLGEAEAAHQRAAQFTARFPNSPFLDDIAFFDAQLGQKDAGCSTQRIHKLLGFLTQFPQSQFADEVSLSLARCYQDLGDPAAAADAYEDYARQFPASPLADEAAYKAALLRSFLVADYRKASSALALQVVRLASGQEEERVPVDVGSLYLESLRDYATARALYRHFYAQDTSAASAKLLLSLATCYHGLAASAYLSAEQSSLAGLVDTAAAFYRKAIATSSDAQERVGAVRGLIGLRRMTKLSPGDVPRWLTDCDAGLALVPAQSPLRAELLAEKASLLLERGPQADSLTLVARTFAADAARLAGDDELRARCHWLVAQLSLAARDTTAAAAALNAIIDHLPRTRRGAQAMMLAATLAEAGKRLGEAEKLYDRILNDCAYAPVADSAEVRLADLLIRQGKHQAAAELLERAREKRASDVSLSVAPDVEPPELKLRLALAYHHLGRSQEAEALLVEFVREAATHPQAAQVLALLATMAEDRGDSQRALNFLRQASSLPAASASAKLSARLRTADLLFRDGDYRAAAAAYQDLIKDAATDSVRRAAWPKLVISLFRIDDRARAIAEAEKYLKAFRDDANRALFAYEEGEFFLRQKDFKQAEKAFRAARDVKNAETAAWGDIGLGKLYLIMNQPDEALKILAGVPTKYPDNPLTATAYVNLGDFYFKNGQFENAFLAFQKALAVPRIDRPYRALALGYLIDAADRLGMWDRAIAFARQYLQEFPRADDAFTRRMQIGTCLKNLKEYDRAIEHFRDLKRFASREAEPEIQYWIGKCYLEMGRYADAIVELMKVKYLSPPSKLPWGVTAMYESGLAYMRLGKLDDARRIFERIEREEGSTSSFGRVARERIKEIDQRKTGQSG
ncbi:MAG: tetratricopeptide repeat protein [Calditrichaeota bacterium]|nr:tetratricopeptide repeat protein [Calditrichota bacterium]